MKHTFIPIFLLLIFSIFSASASEWRDAAGLDKKKGRKSITVKTDEASMDKSVFIYSVPDALTEQTDSSMQLLILGNAVQKTSEGEPTLPVIPVKFVIPAGRTIDKINVVGLKKTRVSGKHTIQHGQALYPLLPNVKVRPGARNASIYESDDEYPKNSYQLVTVQKKHGVRIAIITLNPAVYRPQSGRLTYFKELRLEITTVPEKKSSLKKNSCFPLRLNTESIGLENSDALSSYTTTRDNPAALGLCNPLDSYDWVIVTNEAIRDATTDYTVNDLIAHRQSMGMTTNLTTIESVLASYSGVDNAEKLRNFIIDAYTNWGTQYVLLGGDINIIPMRKLRTSGGGETDDIPSDLYYQCLDGPYNYDGDAYWGETTDGENGGDVDLMAEVYIGRASAENATEMSNFVYKTLKYEKDPEASNYLHTALMCGEYLGFGGVSEYAKESMEEIRLGASTHGYTTAGFASSPSFTVNTLYEADVSWAKADIIQRFNSNDYSIINHLGHANATYVLKFYNSDADNLTNTNPLFLYSQGCIPGNFETDCIAEHLTTTNRHGLYSGVMNARYGWGMYNSTDGPSQRFDRQFWDAYFAEYMFNIGEINADSHEDNLWDITGDCIRWCYVETNLFGDPRTRMRGMTIGPMVSYQSHSINDQAGNGNNIAEPGEQIAIPVTLVNNGSDAASDVSSVIATGDSYVSVGGNSAGYGDIACCGTAESSPDAFTVTIAQNCPTPHTVNFTLTTTDGGGNEWESSFSISVNSVSTVSGNVRSFTGANPVAGATVYFSGPMSGTVNTDAQGGYTLSVIDGSYSLHVESDNYLPSDPVMVTTPPGSSVNFNLYRPAIAVTPSSFNVVVAPGQTSTSQLSLGNGGDAALVYSLTPVDEAAASIVMAEDIYPASHFAKLDRNEIDDRVGLPAKLQKGGPDLFGYRWIDSREVGGPSFTWTDISQTGTLLTDISSCLDCYTSVNLSFNFSYYGNDYSTMYISTKGNVMFGSGSYQYTNYPLPSTSAPANMIAAFWDDMSTSGQGDIYFQDFGDRAIVQFNKLEPYSGSGTFTFQIVLHQNGKINFYYQSMVGTVTSATAGMQNAARDDGFTIVYNSAFIENNLAVEISSRPQWLAVSPESGTSPAGQSTAATVTFGAPELPEGVYNGRIVVAHNDPLIKTDIEIPCMLTVTANAEPPLITQQPENVMVPEEATAQFTVAATGTEPLSYQWNRNGNGIPGATSATYITNPVTLADNGAEFSCVVSNVAGSVTSETAVLTVILTAPTIVSHPANLTVQEGDDAQFTLVAAGSELEYQWQRDGIDIPDATETTYTIPSVGMSDNGTQLTCTVSNAAGSVQSNPGVLTVIANTTYQLKLISIGASNATIANGATCSARDIVIGSNANGIIAGTQYRLFLK